MPVDDIGQGVRRQLLQVVNDRLGGSGKVVTQQCGIANNDLRRFRRSVPPVFGVIRQVEGEAAVPAVTRPQCFRARQGGDLQVLFARGMPDEPADAFDGRRVRRHGQGVELGEAEAVHGAQQAFLRATDGIKQHVEVGRGHGIVPDRG